LHLFLVLQSALLGQDVTLRCVADQSVAENGRLLSQWKANDDGLLGYQDEGLLPGYDGRYYYLSRTKFEKNLLIKNLSLKDNGYFECQMTHAVDGAPTSQHRAKAYVTVLGKLMAVSSIAEDAEFVISCEARNAKPAAVLNWFTDGNLIKENVRKKNVPNRNFTINSQAKLHWTKLTCQSLYKETNSVDDLDVTLNVIYPSEKPKVRIKGNYGQVRAGNNITLSCTAKDGNPPPELKWYYGNRLIGSDFYYDAKETVNDYSMIVSSESNGLEYECRSTNAFAGEPLKTTLQLSVEFLIKIIYNSNSYANPRASIGWQVNGLNVQSVQSKTSDSPRGFITESIIAITAADYNYGNNELVLECFARNEVGLVREERRIIYIAAPPGEPVIIGMNGISVDNNVVNFTCTASGGNPLAKLSWYLGHHKVSHRSKVRWKELLTTRTTAKADTVQTVESVLTLKLNRSMHHQKLRCEAGNEALDNPRHTEYELNIFSDAFSVPPESVTIAKNYHLKAGEKSRLICHSKFSNPEAEIGWEFPGMGMMSLTALYRFVTWDNGNNGFDVSNTIEFIPTKVMDKAIVACFALSSKWARVNSSEYRLNVQYAPEVSNLKERIIMQEGKRFNTNFTVEANPPAFSFDWRKDGISFFAEIGSLRAKGTKSYRKCICFDIIVDPARITEISGEKVVSAGEKVVLSCTAIGIPVFSNMIQWSYENVLVTHGVISGDEGHKNLSFIAAKNMSGTFACLADNGIGDVTAGILGKSTRLRCRARGVPEVKFSWHFSGSTVVIQNNAQYTIISDSKNYPDYESTLIISKVDRSHYDRSIMCVAKNNMGEDTLDIKIGPPSAPETPTNLSSINSTKTSVTVKWNPGFDGGSRQQFQLRYRSVKGGNYHNFAGVLLGLTSSYEVAVRSWNLDGHSSAFSKPVTVFTLNTKGEDMQVVMRKVCFWFYDSFVVEKNTRWDRKTEMVRKLPDGKGEAKAVHMYGALVNSEIACRPESANTNRSELVYERASEDAQSLRTIIVSSRLYSVHLVL
uniref:Nephrin n=1 Tax=Enterobius vermicularis TaxID=51028 RepID=A0A0N4V110_ENTVE